VLAVVPDELGKGKMVAVGQADGAVQFVQLGSNQLVSKVVHDELEGVVGLGFDVGGRMVSGGGSIVKVWHEAVDCGDEEDEGEQRPQKRPFGNDMDDSDHDAPKSSDDDDEKKSKKKRKKRKKGRRKDKGEQHVMAFNGGQL